MSVTVVKSEDVIEMVEKAQHVGPQIVKNFFELLGTNGCLLDCAFKSGRERKRKSWPTKQEFKKRLGGKLQEWFTSSQIAASTTQGCGSCKILSQIIHKSYPRNELGLADEYEYNIDQNFKSRRRPLGKEEPVEIVQLFQPPGLKMRLQRFPNSEFLLGKDKSIARMRQWISECSSTHESCSEYSAPHDESSCPTRLLDITPIQQESSYGIRLIETIAGVPYHYACLSHRWDNTLEHHQTTAGNLCDYQNFISLEKLPKNFRDAMEIARELNIQYLWIDSLCIVQGGDGGQDLKKELAKMGSIYKNGYLTIAAVSSPNSSGGCFMRESWPDICFSVSTSTHENHLIGARVLDMMGQPDSIELVNDHYPLLGRAWVFQERLLSRRILQCNYGEFAFECLESSQCECGYASNLLAPHPRLISKWLGNMSLVRGQQTKSRASIPMQKSEDKQKQSALELWRNIVETYMQLELSFQSDVLPAISGCAQIVAANLKFTYIAGLWKETLQSDLLWYVVTENQGAPQPRPKDSTAPSWSWASVSMGQTIRRSRDEKGNWNTADVLLGDAIREVHCESISESNPFGTLKAAYLRLDAVLYPWYLRHCCTTVNFGRRRPYREMYIAKWKHPDWCLTETRELELDGAQIGTFFDATWGAEESLHENFENFSHCIGTPDPCRLAQVFLLRVLHKEGPTTIVDVFLLLVRCPSINGKPNCYRRIGMMKLRNDGEKRRTWEQMIDGKIEPRREEIWLF